MYTYPWTSSNRAGSNSLGNFLTDSEREMLLESLQEDCPESQRQRIQIMLLADEGITQAEICQILGCCPATARHWIHIARQGMVHQWQDCPIGRPKLVSNEYLQRLKELFYSNPRGYGYGSQHWTLNWLQKHLCEEFGFKVSDRHFKRLLKQMGLSTRRKSSHNGQNSPKSAAEPKIAIADLKKTNTADSSEIILINSHKAVKDLDIYGAQYLRSISISATNQQYIRVFTDHRRILSLSS
ncbi:helix-turn-helix domain-containing protein [Aphanizomenon flos-aquae NRERC-008]|uniref:Helix-turn-helix domain-containing protein n=1 Tax=Aphanizomenon flos-aquae FACHB-1249 TaxID=2692889 RepID=A0ABR8IP78_APHFL|nr:MULTISPECIES: helix-turn-helix domain-containing protein [Aphanizomenon]MBD2391123.1 helix-turn-helix domain-containing protein [Aphanizomenon flos-aquae FACHB-1171]MBD2556446.1 helix-turn-helix domain-containing protein [Aphanizomenon flos-aquae FACHB-1290]MBD2630127.1 helix-turn-helix domain-containing protein [Aphanizomenon sp. FACHB-1399]MBD2641358.1 helix-turn-helix domain-containing protein [Aphanizomenon sp. FACHB-1401]MBD2657762.1 helix-turn-helix domain-containing protein [Aphanizo